MNAHPDVIKIAEQIYEAYRNAVGGKTFNGDPLPDWKTFAADPKKEKQRDAWIASANAARNWICGPQ